MRLYFSSYHLWGARHFAEQAAQNEVGHVGPPKFDVLHRAYVVNCLLSTVAFLEAVINEFFDDAADGHFNYLSDMSGNHRQAVADFWKMKPQRLERSSILYKYQFALLATGCRQFDEGGAPLHDAKILIELRNQLVHSRAKTDQTDSERQERLRSRTERLFPPNALVQGSGNPYFPDHCLGAGCAEWSVRSALAVTDEFLARTKAKANYQTARF